MATRALSATSFVCQSGRFKVRINEGTAEVAAGPTAARAFPAAALTNPEGCSSRSARAEIARLAAFSLAKLARAMHATATTSSSLSSSRRTSAGTAEAASARAMTNPVAASRRMARSELPVSFSKIDTAARPSPITLRARAALSCTGSAPSFKSCSRASFAAAVTLHISPRAAAAADLTDDAGSPSAFVKRGSAGLARGPSSAS